MIKIALTSEWLDAYIEEFQDPFSVKHDPGYNLMIVPIFEFVILYLVLYK